MKRGRFLTLAVMIGFGLLGCAVLLHGHYQSQFEVRYGECLADRNDVRTIRQIVSHERWAALWRAVCRRDARGIRDCVRQLAFGHLRLIVGVNDGLPAAEAYYEDSSNTRYWAQYTLRYRNDRWVLTQYFYGDSAYYGDPGFLR